MEFIIPVGFMMVQANDNNYCHGCALEMAPQINNPCTLIPCRPSEAGATNHRILVPDPAHNSASDVPDFEKDAARYQWLRSQNWDESDLCVVANPKNAVKLGYDCPALHRLDDAIDAAIEKEKDAAH